MAKKGMSDERLAAILEKAIANSQHLHDGRLATERKTVLEYYRGEKPLPMHAGDSKYVSRDVFDAVDSMRATVIEAFSAGSRTVTFRPEKGETVDDAKVATEYCRHVFYKKNRGDDIKYEVLTDGLMNRLSVVKVRYVEMTEDEEFTFDALTPEELTYQVSAYSEFEFKEANYTPEGLMSGTFMVPKKSHKIEIEVIQPEDFMVSSRAASLAIAKYCIHRTEQSKSNLLKMGYDKAKVEKIQFSGKANMDLDYEKELRFDFMDDIVSTDDDYDESVMQVILYEVYIRLDMDGSGTNRLWKICYAGKEILSKEEVSRMPFAAFVPLPTPHTFAGENYAMSVIPMQNARTVLIRQIINHSLITNNPRQQVMNGTLANPSELLENRIGGIVNVRRMDGIAPIPQAPLNPFVFNLINMIDEDKEEVTGISKLSQGLSKDAISTQNAQGMVEQLISQSQQRTKIIARRFGVFMMDLYSLIYDVARDHISQDEFTAVTGETFDVNPQDWIERSAASVELTLGYGEAMQESDKWAQIDNYLTNDAELKRGYDYAHRYEVIKRSMEARGVADIMSILTPPDQLPPPEPSPAEKMQMEQLQAQIEYQKAQGQALIMKAETDRMKAQTDLIKAQAEARHKDNDTAIESEKFLHEQFVDLEELRLAKTVPETQQRASFNPNGNT